MKICSCTVNTVSTYRVNMEAVTIVGATSEEVHISTINGEQHIIQVASNIPPLWYWFGVDSGDLRKLWCIIPPVLISCILYKNCNAQYCQYPSSAYYTKTVMRNTVSTCLLHIIWQLKWTILPVKIACILYKKCDAPYCQHACVAYCTRTCVMLYVIQVLVLPSRLLSNSV
jgi:hypothetical protein